MTTSWLTTIDIQSRPTMCYRVELHAADEIRPLGSVSGVPPHHTSLEPYVSDLLRRGAEGQLLLIDDETGTVVARRRVQPYGMKPRERFRRDTT